MQRKVSHDGHEIVFTVKRSRRRRTVALSVAPSGAVTVYAPYFAWGPFVDRFVRKQLHWILKKLAYFKALAQQRPVRDFAGGGTVPVWGEETPLSIVAEPALKRPFCRRVNGSLEAHVKIDSPNTEADVRAGLRAWYALQMEPRVQESVARIAEALKVSPRSARVANQSRRWGSCSVRGDIRLSWRLAAFPAFILDYVIVHELAHLKVMNHSPRFWAVVESVVPDYRQKRLWMRKNALQFALD